MHSSIVTVFFGQGIIAPLIGIKKMVVLRGNELLGGFLILVLYSVRKFRKAVRCIGLDRRFIKEIIKCAALNANLMLRVCFEG